MRLEFFAVSAVSVFVLAWARGAHGETLTDALVDAYNNNPQILERANLRATDEDLSINNGQVLRRQLEATNDQFQVGAVTRTNVAQAEARLAGATASRQQAEGNLQVSRANYARAVGHVPPGRLAQPTLRPVLPANHDQKSDAAKRPHPADCFSRANTLCEWRQENALGITRIICNSCNLENATALRG